MNRLLFVLLFCLPLLAQDVTSSSVLTTATCGPVVSVKTGTPGGSATYRVTWWSTGFTGYTINLEGSQDNSTFTTMNATGQVLEGSNSTTWSSATASNTFVVRAYLPYVKVCISSLAGSGTVNTLLLGYKGTNATPLAASGGGGGSSTVLLSCNAQAEVALSGTGYTQIVAGSGSTVIKVCKVLVTSSSSGSPTVNTFTASFGTCSGTPTEVFNAAGITGLDSDFSGSLIGAAGAAFCVKEAVAQADKVTVTYIQM